MLHGHVLLISYLFVTDLFYDVFDSCSSLLFPFLCCTFSVTTSHSPIIQLPLPSHYFPFPYHTLAFTFALLPIPLSYSLPSHYFPFPDHTVSVTFALLPIPISYNFRFIHLPSHYHVLHFPLLRVLPIPMRSVERRCLTNAVENMSRIKPRIILITSEM
jgi:hypothetical protein